MVLEETASETSRMTHVRVVSPILRENNSEIKICAWVITCQKERDDVFTSLQLVHILKNNHVILILV